MVVRRPQKVKINCKDRHLKWEDWKADTPYLNTAAVMSAKLLALVSELCGPEGSSINVYKFKYFATPSVCNFMLHA